MKGMEGQHLCLQRGTLKLHWFVIHVQITPFSFCGPYYQLIWIAYVSVCSSQTPCLESKASSLWKIPGPYCGNLWTLPLNDNFTGLRLSGKTCFWMCLWGSCERRLTGEGRHPERQAAPPCELGLGWNKTTEVEQSNGHPLPFFASSFTQIWAKHIKLLSPAESCCHLGAVLKELYHLKELYPQTLSPKKHFFKSFSVRKVKSTASVHWSLRPFWIMIVSNTSGKHFPGAINFFLILTELLHFFIRMLWHRNQ